MNNICIRKETHKYTLTNLTALSQPKWRKICSDKEKTLYNIYGVQEESTAIIVACWIVDCDCIPSQLAKVGTESDRGISQARIRALYATQFTCPMVLQWQHTTGTIYSEALFVSLSSSFDSFKATCQLDVFTAFELAHRHSVAK